MDATLLRGMTRHFRCGWVEGCLLGLLAIAAAVFSWPLQDVGTALDQVSDAFFADVYAERGTTSSPHPLDGVGGTWTTPNGIEYYGERSVSYKFVGFALLAGTFEAIIPGASLGLPVLGAVLATLAVWILARTLVPDDPRWAVFAATLALALPVLFYRASIPYMSTLTAAGLLSLGVALAFLHLGRIRRNPVALALGAGVVGWSLTVRPDGALFLVAVPLVALFLVRFRELPWLIVAGAVALLCASPLLVSNYEDYGDPLTSGRNLHKDPLAGETGEEIEPTTRVFQPQNIPIRILDFIETFPFLVFALATSVGWLVDPGRRDHDDMPLLGRTRRAYAIILLVGMTAFALFFFTSKLRPDVGLQAGTTRYFLAMDFLAAPLIALLVARLVRGSGVGPVPVRGAFPVLLVSVFFVFTMAVGGEALQKREAQQEDALQRIAAIEPLTRPGDVVAGEGINWLFPVRNVIDLRKVEAHVDAGALPGQTVAGQVADVSRASIDAGHRVYFLPGVVLEVDELRPSLAQLDLDADAVGKVGAVNLYRIVASNDETDDGARGA